MSDHSTTTAVIDFQSAFKGSPKRRRIWKFNLVDHDEINAAANLFNWDRIIENCNVHVACRLFTEVLVFSQPAFLTIIRLSRPRTCHGLTVILIMQSMFAANYIENLQRTMHNEVNYTNIKEAINNVTNLVNEANTKYRW
jgi:hypothetical protein